jgi:lysophospholipase L1-like esterase
MNKIIIILVTCCIFAGGYTACGQSQWVGSWVTAQQLTETQNLPPSPGLGNNTLRQVIHATLNGSQIRVLFSNQYGNSTLVINSVHIAVSTGGSSINTSTDTAITFNGSNSVSIPAGQTVWSDSVSFNLTALSNYAVSIYFGSVPSNVTGHPGSRTTSYIQSGNAVGNASISGSTTDHWYILAGIDVATDGTCAAVVTLGDSITDGRGSTTNGNDRWPDALADRFQSNADTNKIAVLNQGIGGNAVVSGGLGPTALSRFDRDVVNQSGVKWCIVLEGVNDIGGGQSASSLISAYQEFINKAHANNILIYGVPILPFGGSQYDSTAHRTTRNTVNDWIRTSGMFDAVIDMDAAVRDPSNTEYLASQYDSGDGLHLNPAGYQAMADSISFSLFSSAEVTPGPTPATSGNIVVRARGTMGGENLELHVDGSVVAAWTMTTSYQDFYADGSGSTIEVHFTNDDELENGMDVQVDYIVYNNTTYQAEDQEVNTGVYVDGSCGGSYSEMLQCNGYIRFSINPVSTSPPGNLGDVNSDGSITIIDALLTAQYYVDLNPQDFNPANADTDCDGDIDIIDALLIAQYYVNLISGFC